MRDLLTVKAEAIQLRKERGLSCVEIAARIDVSPRAVTVWLHEAGLLSNRTPRWQPNNRLKRDLSRDELLGLYFKTQVGTSEARDLLRQALNATRLTAPTNERESFAQPESL